MNKTLYLKEEDGPVWDRARELAGDKLSPVIVSALKSYIAAREAEDKGFERIVVEYNDADAGGIPKAKAFHGRWWIPIEEKFGHRPEADDNDPFSDFSAVIAASVASRRKKPLTVARRCFAVAEGRWGGIAVLTWDLLVDGNKAAERLFTFKHFDDAGRKFGFAIHEAMKRRGIPVEELDL